MRSAHILKYTYNILLPFFRNTTRSILAEYSASKTWLSITLHSTFTLYTYVCIYVFMHICTMYVCTNVCMYVLITNPNIVFSANQFSHQHSSEGQKVKVCISCLLVCPVGQYFYKFSKISNAFLHKTPKNPCKILKKMCILRHYLCQTTIRRRI